MATRLRTRRWFRAVRVLAILGVCTFLGISLWRQNTQSPAYLWQRAQQALDKRDRNTAEVYLKKLLVSDPTHAGAHRALADLYEERVRRAGPGSKDKDSAAQQAYAHLEKAALLMPGDVALQLRMMRIYVQRKSFDQAATVAETVARLGGNDPAALQLVAIKSLNAGKYAAAKQALSRLTGSTSSFRVAWLKARLYQATKDRLNLARVVEGAIRRAVDAPYVMLGGVVDDEREALEELLVLSSSVADDAAAADQRTGDALTVLEQLGTVDGTAARQAVLAARATAVLRVLHQQWPLDPQADPARLAERTVLDRRFMALARPAIDAGTADAETYSRAAEIEASRGDGAAALAILERGIADEEGLSLQSKKDLLKLRHAAARGLVLRKSFHEAEPHIKALLAHEASAGWGHLLAAGVAAQEGRWPEAESHALEARRLLPAPALSDAVLANLYMRLGRWQEASASLGALASRWDSGDADESAWVRRYFGARENLTITQAAVWLAMKQPEQALPLLDALDGGPAAAAAGALRASFHLERNELQAAQDILAAARTRFPAEYSLLVVQVSLLRKQGQDEAAGRLLEQFARDNPRDLRAQLAVAQWQAIHNQPARALDLLKATARRFPGRVEPQLMAAALMISAAKLDQAIELLTRLQQDPAAEQAATLLKARAALLKQGTPSAAEVLAEASPDTARTGLYKLWQGGLADARGDAGDAVSWYLQSAEHQALRPAAAPWLARALARLTSEQGPAETERQVIELIAQHPKEGLLLLVLAELAARQDQLDRALGYIDRFEKLQPEPGLAAWHKALLCQRCGDPKRALAALERLLQADPNHVPGRMLAALLKSERGDHALGLADLDQVIEARPEAWEAHAFKARVLDHANRQDEALAVLQMLLKKAPDAAVTYQAWSEFHMHHERPDKARRALERGAAKLPKEAALRQAQIALLCREKRFDEAQTQAAALAGKTPDLRTSLGLFQLFLQSSDTDHARHWADATVRATVPANLHATRQALADAILREASRSGDKTLLPDARDHYAAIVAAQPRNVVAANNLIWLLITQFDQTDRAVELAARIRRQVPAEHLSEEIVDTLVLVYRKAGRLQDAQELIASALGRNADQKLVQLQAGLTYAQAGKPTAARQALERALALGLAEPRASEAREQLAQLRSR